MSLFKRNSPRAAPQPFSGNYPPSDHYPSGEEDGFSFSDGPPPQPQPEYPAQQAFLNPVGPQASATRPTVPQPQKRGFLVLTVKGAVIWGLGILLLVAWAFVIGVLAGRGTFFKTEAFVDLDRILTGGEPLKTQAESKAGDDQNQSVDAVEKDVADWLANPNPQPKSGSTDGALQQDPGDTGPDDRVSRTSSQFSPVSSKQSLAAATSKSSQEDSGRGASTGSQAQTSTPGAADGGPPAKDQKTTSQSTSSQATGDRSDAQAKNTQGTPAIKVSSQSRDQAGDGGNSKTQGRTQASPGGADGSKKAAAPPAGDPATSIQVALNRFTVQVAAAQSSADAEKAVAKLKSQGYEAYYREVKIKGTSFFRVRVGQYETRSQAKSILDELVQKGFSGAYIASTSD